MSTITEGTPKKDTSKLKYLSKEKQPKRKIKLKKNIKIIIVSLLAIVTILVASTITYNRYEKLNEYEIENYEFYQYFAGMKYEYIGEIKLKRNGEITELKHKGIVVEIDSTPIYFKRLDNHILLPKDMSFYMPRLENKTYRMPYFSRIFIDKSGDQNTAYLQTEKKDLFLEESFLYDGGNLYVFLYKTDIEVDGNIITLSPLSYISVTYKGEIYYYNKESDEYVTIESHKNDVIATIGMYKINLSTDMILYEKSNKLLIKKPEDLQVYKG